MAPLQPALAVHALEHGAVVIWYQLEREEELREPLVELLSGWDSHWVLSPNASIDEPVVATAWERRQSFDDVGEGLSDFIDTYRQRGREKVPCPA